MNPGWKTARSALAVTLAHIALDARCAPLKYHFFGLPSHAVLPALCGLFPTLTPPSTDQSARLPAPSRGWKL
ncbi:hypothetical protein B0H11DRAFT_2221968 [Mycena galericulata]|nr:hypothetical protein B0H11DRAFT_2221968 [Mycena galericulata]